MRAFKLAALGVALISGCFVALGTQPTGIVGVYCEMLSRPMFTLWMGAFIIATLAPPTLAILFWLAAKRTRYAWLLHVFLAPAIFGVVRGSISLMLFAADEPDSDSLTGFATDPAVLLTLICPIIYYCALAISLARRSPHSVNHS